MLGAKHEFRQSTDVTVQSVDPCFVWRIGKLRQTTFVGVTAIKTCDSVDCPNPRIALFSLRYQRKEQTIHGLLHKAWIVQLHPWIVRIHVLGPTYIYTSGKNHFYKMNGDVGMVGW